LISRFENSALISPSLPLFAPHSLSLQMTDAAKVAEWVKVVEKILSYQSGAGNEIGPINIVT
jgi:hypothetical protein